jgi:diguanylate cyclase (GGDEF)-like protein
MTAASTAPAWRPRVLVVDDSPENVRLVGRILKPMADVNFALGGVDGLDRAREQRPDLILLDIDMPDMNGYDVIRALKASEETSGMPVIFLTALSEREQEAEGLDLGANDYVAKPFNAAVVTARVRNQIRLLDYARRLQELNAELARHATTDSLTGLPNRRAFIEVAEREMVRIRRFGDLATVLMLDIDHFKHVNDTYGHDVGDAVLVEAGRRMEAAIRKTDMLARLGGEEFALLMPKTDMGGAQVVAARLLDHLRGKPIPTPTGEITVTATLGVTAIRADDETIMSALKRADIALYDGKAAGRNRIVSI